MITAKHKRIIQQLSILAQDQKGVKRAKVVACMTYKNNIIAYGFIIILYLSWMVLTIIGLMWIMLVIQYDWSSGRSSLFGDWRAGEP